MPESTDRAPRPKSLRTRTSLTRIGENLATWRTLQRLTIKALSERSGVSVSTINRIERGEGASLEHVLQICLALGIPDAITTALDPFESERGRALMAAQLPRRVR